MHRARRAPAGHLGLDVVQVRLHRAHVDCVNIVEMRDGLDFYFDHRSHAEKLTSFFGTMVPMRQKVSRQLISQDVHTGKGKNKYTYSVEILPICRRPRATLTRTRTRTRNLTLTLALTLTLTLAVTRTRTRTRTLTLALALTLTSMCSVR